MVSTAIRDTKTPGPERALYLNIVHRSVFNTIAPCRLLPIITVPEAAEIKDKDDYDRK